MPGLCVGTLLGSLGWRALHVQDFVVQTSVVLPVAL